MRSVVCHNVSLVFRHVSCTSTFEIENLNCPGSYYKKGEMRGGGVLWQDEMIWNWSTCQTRCSPPQSFDTTPPVFISNYDSSLLIDINSNLEKTDSHFNHEHSQLLSSACIFSGPIGGVQCLSKPCADQLKQKIRTNLIQSVVEVWGVSGNKYGRISNLKTLFDTRPGHRGDYFSYKAREELITYWHASSCFDMNVVLLPSIYAKARVCQWRPPLTPHPQRRGRQEPQLLRVKLG